LSVSGLATVSRCDAADLAEGLLSAANERKTSEEKLRARPGIKNRRDLILATTFKGLHILYAVDFRTVKAGDPPFYIGYSYLDYGEPCDYHEFSHAWNQPLHQARRLLPARLNHTSTSLDLPMRTSFPNGNRGCAWVESPLRSSCSRLPRTTC